MPAWLRWSAIAVIGLLLTVVPFFHFRSEYSTSKRFREVERGTLYRSGQMTEEGFINAFDEHKVRTVVNVQEDVPDPDVPHSYWDRNTVKESSLCARHGVKYVHIPTDTVLRHMTDEHRPSAIDRFFQVMDDPANHPVLIHCKAGLHRTGILVAVYRMEYNAWSKQEALRELKSLGFGEFACTPDNVYITQYILTFERGKRKEIPEMSATLSTSAPQSGN